MAAEALSDVGAVKMEQKVGNAKFYQYMKGFGFGQRSRRTVCRTAVCQVR